MKLEMEFAGSEIADVKVSGSDLEISFHHIVIIAPPSSSAKAKEQGVTGRITLGGYKGKKLPKKGVLSDGELYGIPNKALNGRIPIDFQSKRDCELELTIDGTDFTITAKSFTIQVDISTLPNEFRH